MLALWNAGYHSGEMEPLLGIRAESCSQILHRTLTRLRAELKDEIG